MFGKKLFAASPIRSGYPITVVGVLPMDGPDRCFAVGEADEPGPLGFSTRAYADGERITERAQANGDIWPVLATADMDPEDVQANEDIRATLAKHPAARWGDAASATPVADILKMREMIRAQTFGHAEDREA